MNELNPAKSFQQADENPQSWHHQIVDYQESYLVNHFISDLDYIQRHHSGWYIKVTSYVSQYNLPSLSAPDGWHYLAAVGFSGRPWHNN